MKGMGLGKECEQQTGGEKSAPQVMLIPAPKPFPTPINTPINKKVQNSYESGSNRRPRESPPMQAVAHHRRPRLSSTHPLGRKATESAKNETEATMPISATPSFKSAPGINDEREKKRKRRKVKRREGKEEEKEEK